MLMNLDVLKVSCYVELCSLSCGTEPWCRALSLKRKNTKQECYYFRGAYRTVSTEAILVATDLMSIDFLAYEISIGERYE